MIETGTASAGSAPATATPGQGSQAPAAPSGGNPREAAPAQGAPNQGEATGQTPPEQRVLAEQDLDAYIEHTINGRKEKTKIRDLTKAYGMDKAAQWKTMQAAQEMKKAQQLQHLMTTDFDKWCEITGTDRDAFLRSNLSKRKEIAEEILAKEYEMSQMDPHQRKSMELEQQLQQFQSREMEQKKPLIDEIKKIVPEHMLPKGMENATEGQLKEFLQVRQQEFQQGLDSLSNELLDAWQAEGLPKEKDFGAWMAQAMLDHQRKANEHKKRTGEDLPPLLPKEAAVKIKERFLNSTRSLLSQMDAKAIQEVLGEAIVKKLRDYDVGLVSNGPKFDNQNRREQQPPSEPKQYLNQQEWRKAMEQAGNFKF